MTTAAARVYGADSRAARLSAIAVRAGDRAIRRHVAYLADTGDVGRARRMVVQATTLAGRLNALRFDEELRLRPAGARRTSVLV